MANTFINIPQLGPTVGWTVASQAAMLALNAKLGDLALRSDNTQTYILTTNDPTQVANWVVLPTPAGGSGLNQLTGDVTAGPGTGSQAATIATNAVSNAKAAQ